MIKTNIFSKKEILFAKKHSTQGHLNHKWYGHQIFAASNFIESKKHKYNTIQTHKVNLNFILNGITKIEQALSIFPWNCLIVSALVPADVSLIAFDESSSMKRLQKNKQKDCITIKVCSILLKQRWRVLLHSYVSIHTDKHDL